jgi:hypothetical protein
MGDTCSTIQTREKYIHNCVKKLQDKRELDISRLKRKDNIKMEI